MVERKIIHFEDSGYTLEGTLEKEFAIPGQDRKILLVDAPIPEDPNMYSFIYEGDSVLNTNPIRTVYERAYDKIHEKQGLPKAKNLFDSKTFQRHFSQSAELGPMFWAIIAKKYELNVYHSSRSENPKEDFVNTWLDEVVAYNTRVKHPAILDLMGDRRNKNPVAPYLEALRDNELQQGLILSDFDKPDYELAQVVSGLFWGSMEKLGIDKRELFISDRKRISEIACKSLKSFKDQM